MADTLSSADDFPDYLIENIIDKVERMDFKPALEEITGVMAEQQEQNFLTESTATRDKWAELSPATVSRKGHDIILFETGRLKESVRSRLGTSDSIRDIQSGGNGGPHFVVFGTTVPYGIFHQLGTSRMPKREFLGLNENNVDRMADVVARHITRELSK